VGVALAALRLMIRLPDQLDYLTNIRKMYWPRKNGVDRHL
jgi:hypothetical protein